MSGCCTATVADAACRVCDRAGLIPVLCMGEMPLANGLVDPAERIADETFPLHLMFCESCATVQVAETVDPDRLFGHTYAYHSSINGPYVAQEHTLVDRLVDTMGLGADDLVVEVGSNDGYLLSRYVQRGVPVLGVDPAKNLAEIAAAAGVRVHCGFFDADTPELLEVTGRARVLHANNVLAHVPDLHSVLVGIRQTLAPDGVAVVETPYLPMLVGNLQYDTVYHEHLLYWSALAFTRAARHAGLAVVDVERIPSHCGSIRLYATRLGVRQPTDRLGRLLTEEHQRGVDQRWYYADFAQRVDRLRSHQRQVLVDLAQGVTIDAYGAAAKGTVLLNALRLPAGAVRRVYDNTPFKQGRLIPGVDIPIVPADEMGVDPPGVILILAWNFADAIIDQHPGFLANGGRWLIPNPAPRMVAADGEYPA